MAENRQLTNAKSAKNYEFYSQYADIQKEVNAYLNFNADTFGYNARSEVTNTILHSPFSILPSYGYDGIWNHTFFTANAITNVFTANSLNQYTLCASVPPCEPTNPDNPVNPVEENFTSPREPSYDPDGNLLTNGVFTYAYDADNRLASVSSSGFAIATYAYDAQGRRVRKIVSHGGTETQRFDYLWDGWLLVRETATGLSTLQPSNSATDYVWGKDISGTIGGAGGVGGLLYVSICNSSTPNSSTPQLFFPFYDAMGNILRYTDTAGNVVASYTYDAFGRTISATGPLAHLFRHRFSTKYYDTETGLYYYGYRYYSPVLMRWLNRDPIEEQGGVNLYAFCRNSPSTTIDPLGDSIMCCGNEKYNDNEKFCCEKTKKLFAYAREGEWNGLAAFSAFTIGFGVATFHVELTSNLTHLHKKHKLSLTALLAAASIGSPVTATTGKIVFGDYEPEDFGPLVAISSASAAIVGGLGGSVVRIGNAVSIGSGLELGFDYSVGSAIGRTLDYSVEEIPCERW